MRSSSFHDDDFFFFFFFFHYLSKGVIGVLAGLIFLFFSFDDRYDGGAQAFGVHTYYSVFRQRTGIWN